MIFFAKMKAYKNVLSSYDEYLKPGYFYINFKNYRSMFQKNRSCMIEYLPIDSNVGRFKCLKRFYSLFPFYKAKTGNKQFDADAVYFNNAPTVKNIKFFSKTSVITVYLDKNNYFFRKNHFCSATNYGYDSLNVEFDDDKCITHEPFVEKFGVKECDEDFYKELIQYYSKLFKKKTPEYIQDIIDIKKNSLTTSVKLYFDKIKYPCFLQHGDLSEDNVCFKDKKISLIDFDWSGNYTPYYDVFFLAFNSAINGNDEYLNRLISGELDSLFIKDYGNILTLIKMFFDCLFSKRDDVRCYLEPIKNTIALIEKRESI